MLEYCSGVFRRQAGAATVCNLRSNEAAGVEQGTMPPN